MREPADLARRAEELDSTHVETDSDRLLADAADRARRYLATVDHRPVFPDPDAVGRLADSTSHSPRSRVSPTPHLPCSTKWGRQPPWPRREAATSAS